MDLGDLSDLGEGEMRCFSQIGEHGVLVCRVDGVLHAIADRCSHAASPLRDGRLRGTSVVCPLHGARFDVRTGEHRGPPATRPVETFSLRVDAAEAAVEIVLD